MINETEAKTEDWFSGMPVPMKMCPISVVVPLDSELIEKLAVKIEKDNMVLARVLARFREDARSGKEFAWPEYKDIGTAYFGRTKAIINAKGERHSDSGFMAELKKVIEDSSYICLQSVRVVLEYLPSKSKKFRALNQEKSGDDIIDLIAHVRTVLAYAPNDDPVEIEGELPHRTICNWEP